MQLGQKSAEVAAKATIKYVLTHSCKSAKITPSQIWAIWSDINSWTRWDKGLESCVLNGPFIVGQSFSLQPKGAPMPLTTTLLEVEENKKFKDRTIMPLGQIEVTHEITHENDETKITHTIEAHIYEDKKQAFENTLLEKWKKGLPNSVENIVAIIESENDAQSKKKHKVSDDEFESGVGCKM